MTTNSAWNDEQGSHHFASVGGPDAGSPDAPIQVPPGTFLVILDRGDSLGVAMDMQKVKAMKPSERKSLPLALEFLRDEVKALERAASYHKAPPVFLEERSAPPCP